MTAAPENLSDREAVDLLNAVETDEKLFDVRVGEWLAWPLLKMEVMMRLTRLSVGGKGNPPSAAWRLSAAVADAAKLVTVAPADVVIKTGTATVIDQEGARYKDFLFDDLARALPSMHKIESVIAVSHLERRKSALVPALLTGALPDISAAVIRRVARGSNRAGATRISDVMQSRLGLSACTAEWAMARLNHFDASRSVYKRVLRRLCRKTLVVGDPGEFGAVAAARELGLHTVELQHGLLSAHHPAYAWTNVPRESWPQVPVAETVFAYGEYWRGLLEEIPFWRGRVRAAGSLRVDAYRDRKKNTKDAGRLCVVTTQGIDVERLIALLKEARRLQRAPEAIRVTIKLHPGWEPTKEKYEAAFAFDPGVVIQLGSEGPNTLELLTGASLHLSISSFCHYEACALGVPTVVLPLSTSESMSPMVEAGHARRVETAAELAAILDGDQLQTGSFREAADYYFQRGALERMRGLLAELN